MNDNGSSGSDGGVSGLDGSGSPLVPCHVTQASDGRASARIRKGCFSEYFLSTTFFKSKKYS